MEIEFDNDATPISGIIVEPGSCSKMVRGWTYFVSGLGVEAMRKRKGKKFSVWPAITALSYGAIGTGVYYKLESNKSYKKHKEASTFRVSDETYNNANTDHRRFIVLAGAGVAIWAISDLVILLKDRKQYKTCTKNWGDRVDDSNGNDSGPSSSIGFQPYIDFFSDDLTVGVNVNLKF